MNERKTFKKRLTKVFTMALVLSMMLGITANAAGVSYWIGANTEGYVLYSDEACTSMVPESTVLNEDDKIINTADIKAEFYIQNDYKAVCFDGEQYSIPNGAFNYELRTESDVSGNVIIFTLTPYVEPEDPVETPEEDPVEMPEAVPQEAPQEAPVEEPVVINEKTHYGFFSEKVTQDIMNVAQGGTLEIKSEVWHTLTQNVMLALAQRRDINVIITLRYNHEDYQYIIPAGTPIDTAGKYYGPLYLGQLYGMTKLEK